MRPRLLTFFSALSLLLFVATCVLWVRSRFVGDYLVLRDGDFDGCHLSVARGDLRLARGAWRGPHGERMFSDPIEDVGEYSSLKSVYIPLWVIAVVSGAAALAFRWRGGRRATGRCPFCGYDLRATPERCPECGRDRDTATRAA